METAPSRAPFSWEAASKISDRGEETFKLKPPYAIGIASASATVLGPILYGIVIASERGFPFFDAIGMGIVTLLPALLFIPHVILAIWLLSFLAGLGLEKLRLAKAGIFCVLGVAFGLGYFFLGFDNPLIGDQNQRIKIASCFAICGLADGFLYWCILRLLTERPDAEARL